MRAYPGVMQAGARHSMSLRRRLSGTFLVVAALVCGAIVPATAQAAVLDPVQPAVETAISTAPKAADAVRAVESVAGAGQTPPARPVPPADTPAPRPDGGAVQQTVTPVAAATGAATPAAAAPAASAARLREGHRSRVHRISASAASAERLVTARAGRTHNVHVARESAATTRRTALHSLAGTESSPRAGAAVGPAGTASRPALPAPEPSSGVAGANAGAGSSAGFFFGGGLALLVAALLLAGPRLRRRLSLPPAVCRPAAFHVVLERPG